jgi:hypothetical protein
MQEIHAASYRLLPAMKKLIPFFLMLLLLTGCEDVIDLRVPTGTSQLVVDGWVTDQPGVQTIRLTRSTAYFDNAPAPAVTGATVTVTDDRGRVFRFLDSTNQGVYTWRPTSDSALGRVGGTYTLRVQSGTETYQATARLNRVPPIDSLTYYRDRLPVEPDNGPQEGYLAQFFARDPVGPGDCYWIRTYRNGTYFNRPSDIVIAFDAGFSPGSPSDGLLFILPIRQAITRRLYDEGDTLRVELYSIPQEAFFFLLQVRDEAANGGLFATAPSNIRTNVVNTNPTGPKALGFFGASAVSTAEQVLTSRGARPKP